MSPQIHTQFKRPVTRYRAFTMPSQTVPDQTLSLKIMVQKYVKGLPISAPNLSGHYTEDVTAQDFNKLDLAEQEEAIFNASNELSEIKGTMAQQEKEKAANALKEAENKDKEIEELKAKLALQP